MAEAYFIETGSDNIFSIIALGIVVLITGYLCLDSIRDNLMEGSREIRNYFDRMYHEETQRWNERFDELHNLQKATYTATKKNTTALSEKLEELINRIELLEGDNNKALQKLIDLQKKALEGQKNALGLEINYNKENTKQLIKAISMTGDHSETVVLLNKLVEQLEHSTRVIQEELQNIKGAAIIPSETISYEEDNRNRDFEGQVENFTETGWDLEAEVELNTKPSNWSNETELDFEDIDNSWKITSDQSSNMDWDNDASDTDNSWENIDSELNHLIGGLGIENSEEKIPETDPTEIEEPMPEIADFIQDAVLEAQLEKPEIKPLYDDPNKALSADEIAALFASFGQ